MDQPNPCPYCGTHMPARRRKQCGADECARLYRNDRNREYRQRWQAKHGRPIHTQWPDRHRRVATCEVCGTEYATTNTAPRFCSYPCRDAWRVQAGHLPTPPQVLYPRTRIPDDHPVRWTGDTCEVAYKQCAECPAWIVARHHRLYCSPQCKARVKRRTRRARRAGATRSHYTRRDVIDLYGTRCHLCGYEVDPDIPPGSLDSPTLDHVIALANGGEDTIDNVRLAHAYCNSVKGAQDVADVA